MIKKPFRAALQASIAWDAQNRSIEGLMPQSADKKCRTNVSLTASNLAAARELGLNISAISDAALAEAIRAARAEVWARENAEALAERRAWIDANGTPLANLQVLKFD